MAHDYREVANEIDRLIRVGYVGQDLLTRLAMKYPQLTQAEFDEAFEETRANRATQSGCGGAENCRGWRHSTTKAVAAVKEIKRRTRRLGDGRCGVPKSR